MTPKLELINVHKAFGETHVLNGINLQIQEHEVVCLIGPSGCGKSTILRCVDLLDTIDKGQILLDGTTISTKGVNSDEVRRRIGIVFQSY
ncbi:MAG: polar amino acid transport system ATP-binding protein, partial [Acidimicrobiales bacterium]